MFFLTLYERSPDSQYILRDKKFYAIYIYIYIYIYICGVINNILLVEKILRKDIIIIINFVFGRVSKYKKKTSLFIKCSTGFFLNKLGLIRMASSNSLVLQRSHRPQVKDTIWSRDLWYLGVLILISFLLLREVVFIWDLIFFFFNKELRHGSFVCYIDE